MPHTLIFLRHLMLTGLVVFLLFNATVLYAERIKDLASVQGVRENELVGYGLVVGLNATGDNKAPFSEQSLKSMLAKFGINVPAGVDTKSKNIAAVAVTAKLPPFAKPGQKVDVTVSSLGNAKSLQGGQLLMTPLKGMDGNIYAVAQGNLLVGGLDQTGADGSQITINIPSNGRIPNGAMIEQSVPGNFLSSNTILFHLHTPDFTTATRMVNAMNDFLGEGSAKAMDGSSIQVIAPMDASQRVAFLSVMENLEVQPAEAPARVIVNSRTGTVIIGQDVTVSPAAITHGNLSVNIAPDGQLQMGDAEPEQAPDNADGDNKRGISLNKIVQSMNKVGAAPSDIVAILESLKQAGALHADIIVL